MSNLFNNFAGITNFSSIARIDTVNSVHWFQGNVGIGNTTPAYHLDVTGTINATTLRGTLSTAAQGNITSVGTLTSLTVGSTGITVNSIATPFRASNGSFSTTLAFTDPTGDRTVTFPNASITVNAAADLSGNTLASGITASSLTSIGTLTSLNMGGNIVMNNNSISGANTVTATTLTGTLSTAAQANITSLGTLTSLNMGGNIVMNNNSISGANTVTATTLTGTLSTAAQANITSVGTLTSLTVGSTGITVNSIATPFKASNGSFSTTLAFTDPTGDRTVTFPNASITVNAAADLSGNTLASGVTASSLTSVGTLTSLNMGGNIVMNNNSISGANTVTATTLTGTLSTAAQANITSLGTLTSLNMGGNIAMNNNSISGANTVTATTLTGTLSTAAQANITSLGTLTSLTVGSTGITVNSIATPFRASNGSFTTTLAFTDPTGDRTVTFPNASITVNAAADLSGNTLASGVTASSLTSVGTLTGLTTSGNIICGGAFRGPGTNFYSFTSNAGTVGDLFINSGGGSNKFIAIRPNGDGSTNTGVEFDATNSRILFRNTAGTGFACFHSSNGTLNIGSSVGTSQTERLYVDQNNFIVGKFKRSGGAGAACNILFENSNGSTTSDQCYIGVDSASGDFVIGPSYTKRYQIGTHIIPAADGTQNLGSESFRFANTFSVNGYNTSKMAVGVNTTQTEPLYVEGNNFTICKLKRSGGSGGGAQILFENSSGTGIANQCQIGVQGTNNDFLISPATTARWRFNVDLLPEGNATQNIGSSSRNIANIFARNTAKAWISFTLFGGVYSLKSTFGVSSITYISTSNFTVNFSTAFADTNYCWVASAGFTNNIAQQNWVSSPSSSTTWKSTTSLTLVAVYQNNIAPNNNATDINVVIFSL